MVDVLRPKHNHSHQHLSKQDEPTLSEVRSLTSDEVDGTRKVSGGENEIAKIYKDAVQQTRDDLDEDAIREALAVAAVGEIFELIDLSKMRQDLSAIESPIKQLHSEGMRQAVEDVNRFGDDIPYTPNASSALRWIRGRLDGTLSNFRQETERAIRQAIERGLATNLSEDMILQNIKDSIGLTHRQTAAVFNFRRMIENQNSDAIGRLLNAAEQQKARKLVTQDTQPDQEEVNELTTAYADHLVNSRAERIGALEANEAFNKGKINTFRVDGIREAIAVELIRKTWVTAQDEKVCPWCSQLHGETLQIFERHRADVEYSTKPGIKSMSGISPPIHPRCRCRIVITVG